VQAAHDSAEQIEDSCPDSGTFRFGGEGAWPLGDHRDAAVNALPTPVKRLLERKGVIELAPVGGWGEVPEEDLFQDLEHEAENSLKRGKGKAGGEKRGPEGDFPALSPVERSKELNRGFAIIKVVFLV